MPPDPVLRLTIDQYHQMVGQGILTEDDPVELLDGWLIIKMPKNPPHRLATRLVRLALERLAPSGCFVESQEPITLVRSEPEPDVTVIRGAARDFRDRHPGPEDVLLVVEVADASLQRDRTTKRHIYAEAGLRLYWIVNLVDRRIEVYSEPSSSDLPDYDNHQHFGPGAEIPLVIDGKELGRIPVAELLP